MLDKLELSTLNESRQMIKAIGICGGKSYLRSLPESKRLRGTPERDSGVNLLWIRRRRGRSKKLRNAALLFEELDLYLDPKIVIPSDW